MFSVKLNQPTVAIKLNSKINYYNRISKNIMKYNILMNINNNKYNILIF